MSVPQFIDISSFQGVLDFNAYAAWSRQWDGIARIAMKCSEGVGFTDPRFIKNRASALSAGIDEIYYYHFGRPGLGNSSIAEANWQRQVVGNVRDQDVIMLDLEEESILATGSWAYVWLAQQAVNYAGNLPGIYASSAYILQRLQDARLAKYPLWLAKWEYTPDERPPCPLPWSSYQYVQYTDKGTNIPGTNGPVDVDIFLGLKGVKPMSKAPSGWTDDGTILKAPDGKEVKLGFRDHILNSPSWDPANTPLEPELHKIVLEQSNPALGPGQRQLCKKTSLEYTDKMGVFEGWPGQEILYLEKQQKDLQAQVKNLQAQLATSQAQVKNLQAQLNSIPVVENFQQITVIGQRIQSDVDLILKLSQVI